MTATELLAIAREQHPETRYARHRNGKWIAAFVDGGWHTVAGLLMTDVWVGLTGNIRVNGELMHEPGDWIE